MAINIYPHYGPNDCLTTNENLDFVTEVFRSDVFLDKIFIDVTSWTGPAVSGFVNNVDYLESFGMFLLERIKFFTENDIGR